MFLGVEADQVGWDVDHLLADADVALFNEDTCVVDRFGECEFEHFGLEPTLEKFLSGELQNEIQLLLILTEEAVQLALAKIRKAARHLLTLPEKDPKRLFEGASILRKMQRYGLLGEDEQKLDFVLQLTTQKFLERRLQTKVFKLALAKSIHHARVLIKQRHIRVGKQMVNVPSYLVRTDSEKHIDFANSSPFGANGRPGRVARKRAKGTSSEE